MSLALGASRGPGYGRTRTGDGPRGWGLLARTRDEAVATAGLAGRPRQADAGGGPVRRPGARQQQGAGHGAGAWWQRGARPDIGAVLPERAAGEQHNKGEGEARARPVVREHDQGAERGARPRPARGGCGPGAATSAGGGSGHELRRGSREPRWRARR